MRPGSVFRFFLLASLCVTLASADLSPAALADATLLVTIGEVTPERAMLWVRGQPDVPIRVRYAAADDASAQRSAEIPLDVRRDHTGRLALAPLRPGTRYDYEVTQVEVSVSGSFVTAPRAHADERVRFLWSGDLGGSGHCRDIDRGYAIFNALRRHRPDFFLFVGDTIYADHRCGQASHAAGADYVATTLREFHGKHRYNRADPVLQEFFRTTSVFPIWDDHEVRNNFAGPTEPLSRVGLKALLDYWPIEPADAEPGRLYRDFRWGRHLHVFVLDTRQHRSPRDETDGPAKTMLGAAQKAWLFERLASTDATWKVIVTSVPLGMFTGGDHSDSWSNTNLFGYPRSTPTGYVHERDTILRFLRDRRIRDVVFISGDVHHAELLRHEPWPGFVVHELLAGPLAARQGFPRFLDRSLNSRSLGALGFAMNFGEVIADGTSFQARIFDETDSLRVSARLTPEQPATDLVRDQSREPGATQR